MTAGPYFGLKVVDLTRVLAGPYCTMMLADLGATVIKVEAPGTGDDARHIGPFINGKSAYFMSLNRGKHSIALDLKAPDGRAVFEQLLSGADLLVENYRGGTMEKLKYDWPTLHARFPKLIYVAISGFGHTGPYKEKPAYDMVVQGMGGVMSLTGHPGSPPTRVGTSIGDLAAGIFALSGIGAALYHRERTGETQKLDIAMLDCQVALLENAIARYVATGKAPGPLGARHPSITPFGAFAAADQPIIIAAGNNQLFERLCAAIEAPWIAKDARFTTNELRNQNHAALTGEMEDALKAKPAATWLEVLDKAGIPCGPINDVAQVLADPHVLSRNMVVTMQDADAGTLKLAGNPIKLSAFADPATRPPAQSLDESGQEIRNSGFQKIG
ncbi:MAG: CoA transferase [Micropepsaceae bacterium]